MSEETSNIEHRTLNLEQRSAEIKVEVTPGVACVNCGAVSPLAGRASDGRVYCCIHCCFHPLGCRCKRGEFGVEETQQWEIEDEDEDENEDGVCNL